MTHAKSTPKKRRKTSTARTRRTDWTVDFLNNLKDSGVILDACAAAKIGRTTYYERYRADEAFHAKVDLALEDAGDVLEREARRRAVEGVEEPVFGSLGNNSGTGEVGTIRKYSDTLLIFLLKGIKPEKFRERHEVSGPGGGPIPYREIVAELTPQTGAQDEDHAQPVED